MSMGERASEGAWGEETGRATDGTLFFDILVPNGKAQSAQNLLGMTPGAAVVGVWLNDEETLIAFESDARGRGLDFSDKLKIAAQDLAELLRGKGPVPDYFPTVVPTWFRKVGMVSVHENGLVSEVLMDDSGRGEVFAWEREAEAL